MANIPRPPESYIHGVAAPIVIVPARVATWLERYAGLNDLRVRARGNDPEVDSVLQALHRAALHWRTTVTGTNQAPAPEEPAQSKWMGTTEAAAALGITDRAVRLAITQKRLAATTLNGRYRLLPEDIEHFKAAKAA
ncbi:helix-turn-helix domain-containing protein [Arthrobacter sp. R4-81]